MLLGGETVADSARVQLLQSPGQTAVYLFPSEDVRTDLLQPSERTGTAPALGAATFWTVRAGALTSRVRSTSRRRSATRLGTFRWALRPPGSSNRTWSATNC
ncbi:MAG: DUF427 domain-containing protein [Mycobacteriales bacterium]